MYATNLFKMVSFKPFWCLNVQLKGKKPRKETTTSSNIDEGCFTTKSEEKLNNRRRRRSGNTDKKKKKKNNGDEETERDGDLSGYVHVRARRGQATDSHSLAERVHNLILKISLHYYIWPYPEINCVIMSLCLLIIKFKKLYPIENAQA